MLIDHVACARAHNADDSPYGPKLERNRDGGRSRVSRNHLYGSNLFNIDTVPQIKFLKFGGFFADWLLTVVILHV